MSQATQPVTTGIASVQALLDWTPASDPFFVFNRASVPLVPRATSGARMLDCQGLDFAPYPPQGNTDPGNYTLGFWQSVDVFTFFGGSVPVTTPPPGWINAGHRNGVPVLGTFFAKKEADVDALVADTERSVTQLVAVAQAYGFDGWFFNVEEGTTPQAAEALIELLRSLRSAIHAAIPGSLVIWYDALLPGGTVDYQNELNANNAPFFEAVDGMFTNFWWTPEGPGASPQSSADYAASQGLSPLPVFTAVDCYGRSSPSSGLQSGVALQAAVDAGTSLGMFCPAWTWQNANTPLNGSPYAEGDPVLWAGIAGLLPPRPAVTAFPFVTHFDQGFGNQFCIAGQISNPHWAYPWSNVSQQDVLPSARWALAAGSAQACSVRLSNACPFDGGSCLQVGGDPAQGEFATYSLFASSLPVGSEALTLSFTYVPAQLPQGNVATYPDIAVALRFDDGTAVVGLAGETSPCDGRSLGTGVTPVYVAGTVTSAFGKGAAGTFPSWNVVTVDLGTAYAGRTIVDVMMIAAWLPGTADEPVPYVDWTALGEIKLLSGASPDLGPATALACAEVSWQGATATLNLQWEPPSGTVVRHYDVYQDSAWIGRAFCPAFWVGAAAATGPQITFGVRCADAWGQFQDPGAMATVTLPVPDTPS